MKIVKFASIVLGTNYHPETNTASFSNAYNDTSFFGVSSIEEACSLAKQLMKQGYECIELCGAFGDSGAKEILKVTDGKVAIGYSVHFEEQNTLFDTLFS